MRELSLFTGAGGGLLGSLILGFRTVAAVEIDPYCQRVLCARGGHMADAGRPSDELDSGRGQASGAASETEGEVGQRERSGDAASGCGSFPVHGDVRTFHPVPGSCDIVTGGFPCQPFSQAGKRLGEDDPRNMWPHAVRVLRESGAPLGFFENVPGLLSSGYFGTVLGDLAEAGFDAEWCVLGADDVGAPHRRKRLWILAYSPSNLWRASRHDGRVAPDGAGDRGELADSEGQPQRSGLREDEPRGERRGRLGDTGSPWWCDPADVGHADESGPQGYGDDGERAGERAAGSAGAERIEDPWLAEPYVGRVATGVASRVDRLRALGSGQVPQTMAAAFTYLAREAGIPRGDDVSASVPTATRDDGTNHGGRS